MEGGKGNDLVCALLQEGRTAHLRHSHTQPSGEEAKVLLSRV